MWTHTELSLGWAVVEACWLQWGIAQGPCKPWGIVEPSTVLSNLSAILAVTCLIIHYLKFCGLTQLPCIISHSFWGQRAKLVGQGTLGSVHLCFTMPEASAFRGLKAGELGSSKGSVMHMPGGWFRLKSYLGRLAVTLTQGLCSLGFLTTWWLGFRGKHRDRESTRAPESTRQKLYPLDELTSSYIISLPQDFTTWRNHKTSSKFKGREPRSLPQERRVSVTSKEKQVDWSKSIDVSFFGKWYLSQLCSESPCQRVGLQVPGPSPRQPDSVSLGSGLGTCTFAVGSNVDDP